MSEYIEVRGTENAYDSGLWFGRSMKTTSTVQLGQSVKRITTRCGVPSSSSSSVDDSSILVNFFHSSSPFSFRRLSGIHARKYTAFVASYIDESVHVQLLRGAHNVDVPVSPRLQSRGYCPAHKPLGAHTPSSACTAADACRLQHQAAAPRLLAS